MERIENHRGASHQKVPGKIHAVDMKARPPRHFHVNQRERNGNAGAPLQHLVEEAVAGVVVSLAVAGEALFVEQIRVEHVDGGLRGARILQAAAGRPAGRGLKPPWRRAAEDRAPHRAAGTRASRSSRPASPGRDRAQGELREFLQEGVFHAAPLLSRIICSSLGMVMSLRRSTTRSAPASLPAGYVCVTATVRRPAFRAASSPQCESSIATHEAASTATTSRSLARASR